MFEEFSPEIGGNLKQLSNIGVGGTADYIIRISRKSDLVRLSSICRKHSIRMTVVGHGTNLFFSDGRVQGVIAVVDFSGISLYDSRTLQVQAGTSLGDLLKFSFQHSLSGLEWFSGIPGTVGGAIFGNAGAYGTEIGSLLNSAEVITGSGELARVGKDFFEFGYRDSSLKRNEAILLEAELQLTPGEVDKIRGVSEKIIDTRKRKLPSPGTLTVGSYFKNLQSESGERKAAAAYLDAVGAKECRQGGIGIYARHANIFCNQDSGNAEDILGLEKLLREKVRKRFGITLQREVVYIS